MSTPVVLVGCEGQQVNHKSEYELHIKLMNCKMLVPVLVMPGQTDDVIIVTNVLKRPPSTKKFRWILESNITTSQWSF